MSMAAGHVSPCHLWPSTGCTGGSLLDLWVWLGLGPGQSRASMRAGQGGVLTGPRDHTVLVSLGDSTRDVQFSRPQHAWPRRPRWRKEAQAQSGLQLPGQAERGPPATWPLPGLPPCCTSGPARVNPSCEQEWACRLGRGSPQAATWMTEGMMHGGWLQMSCSPPSLSPSEPQHPHL